MVPALAPLGGPPMPVAVGTSMVVIAMKSFAGLAGYLSSVSIDWGSGQRMIVAAIVGSFADGRLAGRISADLLRIGVRLVRRGDVRLRPRPATPQN